MSSMFDSKVYDRRNHTPWSVMSLVSFISDAIMHYISGEAHDPLDAEVVLRCRYRHDVASRKWWTLEWKDCEGTRREVSSQHYDLLLWRAAQAEKDAERRHEGLTPVFAPDMILEAINAKTEETRMEVLKRMAKHFDVRLADS